MVMNQGVDAQVQNRVDAYRNNPQQLMQMYQQNQELVDLLALQKLKSEKESAAREMQMQMQQQPGTIAQQREQEVLQLTKNELAQQTQGVLQRKQQQQQANLQRAAQGGLGALAQQGPAPAPAPQGQPQGQPMPRMAGGGIVSFQPGGAVNSSMIHTESGLRYSEMSPEQLQLLANFGDRLAAEVLAQDTAPRRAPGADLTVPGPNNRRRGSGSATSVNLGSAIEGILGGGDTASRGRDPLDSRASAPEIATDAPTIEPPQIDQTPPSLPTADTPPGTAQRPVLPAPATAQEAISTVAAPATAAEAPGGGLAGLAGGAGSMGGAESALMRGVGISDKVLGREEKAGRYADMEAQLAELDSELYDPEAERRQQLQAFLIGTAGATNIGYAMAGGAAAAINLENRQKQNRRSRMVDRLALSERGMTLDSELGRSALSLGQQMFADFNANQRTAISAGATLSAARIRAVADQARLDFDREKEANADTFRYAELEVREAENAVAQARDKEVATTRRIEGVLKATDNLIQRSTAIHKQAAELYGLEEANYQLSTLTPDDRDYEAARKKVELAEADANAYATQFLEEFGINDRLEELERQFYELSGLDAMPGINPDDILNVEQQ